MTVADLAMTMNEADDPVKVVADHLEMQADHPVMRADHHAAAAAEEGDAVA